MRLCEELAHAAKSAAKVSTEVAAKIGAEVTLISGVSRPSRQQVAESR